MIYETRECLNDRCRHQWSGSRSKNPTTELSQPTGPVPYHRVKCRCPGCDAINPRVQHTEGKMRRHFCDGCHMSFHSEEAE